MWVIKQGDTQPTLFPSTQSGLQAGFDSLALTPNGGEVWLGPGQITGITNLTMYANTTLMGSGMNITELVRDAAATGVTIREKTTAEGNGGSGATGIWLRDFKLNGNGSVGDGIDIGNQGGPSLNINAGLDNVYVTSFTSGYGMKINGNATQSAYVWSNNNQYGILFAGGSNKWYSVRAENNTSNNILLGGSDSDYFGIHCEEGANAGSSGTIEVTGNNNRLWGVTVAASYNRQNIIVLKSSAARLTVFGANYNANGHTFSNLIYDEALAVGTGSSVNLVNFWVDNGSSGPAGSYFFNSSTGDITRILGGLLPFQPASAGNTPTAGTVITVNPGMYIRLDGNGTVDTINMTGVVAVGIIIVLVWSAAATVKDGTGNCRLNGDFLGNVGSTLSLIWDGTYWNEMSRSLNS